MKGIDIDGKKRGFRQFGFAASLVVALAPISAHADGMIDPSIVHSWIDIVNASQAAQPHWMTPLACVRSVWPKCVVDLQFRPKILPQVGGTSSSSFPVRPSEALVPGEG
jgi:hypothetical protein